MCIYVHVYIGTRNIVRSCEQPVDTWTYRHLNGTAIISIPFRYGTLAKLRRTTIRPLLRIKILEIIVSFCARLRIPTGASNTLDSRCPPIPQRKLTLSAGWGNRGSSSPRRKIRGRAGKLITDLLDRSTRTRRYLRGKIRALAPCTPNELGLRITLR